MVTIKVNGEERKYQKGTSLEVVSKDFQKDYDAQILIAIKNDNIFKRIEEKTNVDRDTIINLARKLQNGNYKNEQTLKEIIHELSDITGIEVSTEKEEKIINTIINDKVPNDLEKYI